MRSLGYSLIAAGLLIILLSLVSFERVVEIVRSLDATRVFAVSLILLGASILVKHRIRTAIMFSGVVLLALSVIASAYSVETVKVIGPSQNLSIGEIHVYPEDFKNGSLNVRFDIGQVVIELPRKPVNLTVKGGIGEVRIIVPQEVRVEFSGNVGLGKIEGLKEVRSGEIVSHVRVQLGIGEIRFIRH